MTPALAAANGARLRLAFVLWSGTIGGAETFFAALARALRDSDVDARLVMITDAGPLAHRLGESGVPFSVIGLGRGRTALRHPRRVADAVRAAGADGAVLVSGGYLALALRIGGYRRRIVAVEHGSVLQIGHVRRRSRFLDRVDELLGARAVDVHVAVSRFLRGRMRNVWHPVVTIPNGVDLDVFRPAPRTRDDGFVVGCMARLVAGKGVEDVLTGAQPALHRGAMLRIAGEGPLRSQLEQQAERLGVADRVAFEGWIGNAVDVASFWNSCDVAVVAPNELVESFGLVAVEAMACTKPVVATRAGALAETVVDGETGVLVAPRDTDALAAALLGYLHDPALVERHGTAARAWCEQEFDIGRCALDYMRLFEAEEPHTPRRVRRSATLTDNRAP